MHTTEQGASGGQIPAPSTLGHTHFPRSFSFSPKLLLLGALASAIYSSPRAWTRRAVGLEDLDFGDNWVLTSDTGFIVLYSFIHRYPRIRDMPGHVQSAEDRTLSSAQY